MTSPFAPLPSDLASAHAMILAERAARLEAEAVAARARAVTASTEALIAHFKLEIEKLRRALYGSHSERKARLLEQMELQLEAAATEDELAAEKAAAPTQGVKSFERKRPSRKPFPEHLPRERVVIPAPDRTCPCFSIRPSDVKRLQAIGNSALSFENKRFDQFRFAFLCSAAAIPSSLPAQT